MSEKMISIVVPVYKEEKNIEPFLERMERVLFEIKMHYEIIFCLDPSPDKTYEKIIESINRNNNIKLIQFSRRFGQPAATMAGILNCKGDICVVIDVDLQDPPEIIPQLIEKWEDGYNVVYAKRRSRQGETRFKLAATYWGYKLINRISDVQIPTNTGDFRLMDRTVMEELRKLPERNGFLRGLVAFVGYKQTYVEFDRDKRLSGAGNYNRYLGSFRINMNSIVCFSARPLQLMSIFGFFTAFVGFLMAIYYMFQKLVFNPDVTPGLSSTVIFITIFSGIQILSTGLLGEYVARIYEEVKRRPMYIISEIVDRQNTDNDKN